MLLRSDLSLGLFTPKALYSGLLLCFLLSACSSGGSSGGASTTPGSAAQPPATGSTAPSASPTAPPVPAPTPAPAPAPLPAPTPVPVPAPVFTLPTGSPLTPALKAEIARMFAPQQRFNAFHNDGNPSPQNRHEDFFPMGVASYFRELESGMARVMLPPGSVHQTVSTNMLTAVSALPEMTDDQIKHQPRFMAGDAPGSAPLYTNLYLDPASPALQPDGSGELVVYAEYYVFYPQDRSEAQIFTFIPTIGVVDFTGHRGDWEHTVYRLRAQLDPGMSLQGGIIEQGFYSAHSHVYDVDPAEIETVNDAGQPDPSGTHPVVYISQGKHAAYPQAGEYKDRGDFPSWLASHTDFFRGNGVVVDCWNGELFDLEDPVSAASEFASPDFLAIIARSGSSSIQQLSDWTEYEGDWGSDDVSINLLFTSIGIASSPSGAKQMNSYGAWASGNVSTLSWSDTKQNQSGLTVYVDQGISIPAAIPAPLPLRQ